MWPTTFAYTQPAQRLVFGAGAIHDLPRYLAEGGWGRILICTSPSQQSIAAQIQVDVGGTRAPERVTVFAEAAAHVPAAQVAHGVALARAQKVEAVLGLGGGSAIGLAKAIGFTSDPPLACLAIPTTYAGSEMTPVFGITMLMPEGPRKITTRHARVTPQLVVYDPTLTLHLPPALTATTAMNALAHAIEALYSPTRHPLSSALAEAALQYLVSALWPCVQHGEDLTARTQLMLGAHLAGAALATVEMGLHHGACHVLGGAANVPHGAANTIVLPHAMRFNVGVAAPALATVARALGANATNQPDFALAETAIRQVEALLAQLPVPRRLREVNVARDQLPALAEALCANPTLRRNPRPLTQPAEALAFLEAMW